MALATTIYVLVILGTMISAGFFIALQDQRAGSNTLKVRHALGAAEAGAERMVTDWNGAFNQLSIGDSASFGGWLVDGSGWYRGTVHRVGELLFLLRSEGFSRDSAARSEIALITKLRIPQINIRSALETQGEIEVGGNGHISGVDTIPPGLDNCAPLGDVPGLLIQDDSDIDYQGINHVERGMPPVLEDNTISDSSLTTFGDLTFADLAALATHTMSPNTAGTAYRIEPSLVGGECNVSDVANWGEPLNLVPECETYFPVVHTNGDLHINMERGQGLLIVDGDLYVKGQFRFYGVAIVRGKFVSEGTGGHIFGGVIAANLNDEHNRIAGNAQIYFSSCAIRSALAGSAPGEPLRERAWAQIF